MRGLMPKRDSYERFFSKFGIHLNDLIEWGLSETIFPDDGLLQQAWEDRKDDFARRRVHWIRHAGRNGSGTKVFQRFYQLLVSLEVRPDGSNNTEPRKMLRSVTPGGGANLQNYQVSHIFAFTKNPILFTAPWNIVWKPKVLDPFTGHEASGPFQQAYRKAFFEHVSVRYRRYIEEYEAIRKLTFVDDEIWRVIEAMDKNGDFGSEQRKESFLRSVSSELGRFTIESIGTPPD